MLKSGELIFCILTSDRLGVGDDEQGKLCHLQLKV